MRSLSITAAFAAFAAVGALGAQQPQHATSFTVPTWAYPNTSPPYRAARGPFDDTTPLHVPNSDRSYTLAQIKDSYGVPDWFPSSHPEMPKPVARGEGKKVPACGFCHLPGGEGRTENASLAGVSADYIIGQMKDWHARTRKEAIPTWSFAKRMEDIADSVSDADLAIAAKYFASIRPKPRVKVLERDTIQRVYQASGLYALHPDGGREALGDRIIEITEDLERFEMRDPQSGFIAYVPMGSIARGKAIAHAGGKNAPNACATCHGENLQGKGPAPLLAGRSPQYILRQLLAFKTKARNSERSAPMQQVTSGLTLDDMIAAAAYAGSVDPRRPEKRLEKANGKVE